MIFPEITEGLGCLLGGFCLSMWLLALKPGGLLISSGAKGIFIAAFCVGVYALSFSHYTRPYALIASTSFAGATAVVLGIDCFSRAGLKEFWLYLWGMTSIRLDRSVRTEILFAKGTLFALLDILLTDISIRRNSTEQGQFSPRNRYVSPHSGYSSGACGHHLCLDPGIGLPIEVVEGRQRPSTT